METDANIMMVILHIILSVHHYMNSSKVQRSIKKYDCQSSSNRKIYWSNASIWRVFLFFFASGSYLFKWTIIVRYTLYFCNDCLYSVGVNKGELVAKQWQALDWHPDTFCTVFKWNDNMEQEPSHCGCEKCQNSLTLVFSLRAKILRRTTPIHSTPQEVQGVENSIRSCVGCGKLQTWIGTVGPAEIQLFR